MLSAKRNETQRKTKHDAYIVSPVVWRKGTYWDEAMSNSEEIKPVATSIVELR